MDNGVHVAGLAEILDFLDGFVMRGCGGLRLVRLCSLGSLLFYEFGLVHMSWY